MSGMSLHFYNMGANKTVHTCMVTLPISAAHSSLRSWRSRRTDSSLQALSTNSRQDPLFQDQGLAPTDNAQVWDVVFEAQTQSMHQMRENSTAASIDIAAREVISEAGHGDAFTHRVGHGIGIKGRESSWENTC